MDYINLTQERHSRLRHLREIVEDVIVCLIERYEKWLQNRIKNTKVHDPVFNPELLPNPAGYYKQQLGIKVSSDRVKTKCPFSHDHIPANIEAKHFKNSLTLYLVKGGFYCKVCKVSGGDVLAFQRKRYGQSFKQAVTALNAWVGDSP